MNIEEIDKWLDNEYGVSYTELEKLHDFVVDRDIEHQEQKDKVVNDLLKRISNLEFEVEDKDRENERLNNIINELKMCNSDYYNQINTLSSKLSIINNYINELDNMFYETFRISQNGYYSISEWELKEFTDKIKELKGEDKNTTC